jgi:DNA invertase Pin-like site-specific DNA recombinase
MPMLGYARVSTRDQDLAGQVTELTAAGCANVYRQDGPGRADQGNRPPGVR